MSFLPVQKGCHILNYIEQKELLLKLHVISIVLCFYKLSCKKCNLLKYKQNTNSAFFYEKEEIEKEKKEYELRMINESETNNKYNKYFNNKRRIDDEVDEDST